MESKQEENILNETITNQTVPKKKTYKRRRLYPITKYYFEKDILATFPDFPEGKIDFLYADENTYFLKFNKRKYVDLTKLNYLKFLKMYN